mmetsp:Transcript_122422/g.346093  ORF Transcript_122422/g.346093 Transcript_122422/m.346093 type:complete len:447 (+) Transcript_122422:679-2019(+)
MQIVACLVDLASEGGCPQGWQDSDVVEPVRRLPGSCLELHYALEARRWSPFCWVHALRDEALLRLHNLESHQYSVIVLVHNGVESSIIRSAEGAGFLEGVARFPSLHAQAEPTLYCATRWSIKKERAEAIQSPAVARGVKNELQALEAGDAEVRTADAFSWREAHRQLRCLLDTPLNLFYRPCLQAFDVMFHLVEQLVVDVPMVKDDALWSPRLGRCARQADIFEKLWLLLDHMFHVAIALEDFNADAKRVVGHVDLVLDETQPLRAIGHPSVEDLLQRLVFAANKESEGDVHTLASPEKHSGVAHFFAGRRRVRGPKELQLQLEAMKARHVELRREPTPVLKPLICRIRAELARRAPHDPVDTPRIEILDLSHSIPNLLDLYRNVSEARFRVLVERLDFSPQGLLHRFEIGFGDICDLLQLPVVQVELCEDIGLNQPPDRSLLLA